MKKMKKFASLLMAVAMVFSMVATSSAAGNGSIVISNVIANTEYHAYRILDLVIGAGSDGVEGTADDSVRYTANPAWEAFVNSAAVKDVYLTVDASGTVAWKTGVAVSGAANLAALAEQYIDTVNNDADDTNNIAADATKSSPATVDSSTKVTLTGLDLGYYLVDSTGGALCVLDSTDPVAEIKEKNEPVNIEKEVLEEDTGNWGTSNIAEIGDDVEYRATFEKTIGGHNYVVHDKMDQHLILVEDSFEVYRNDDGTKQSTKKVDAANYTINLAPTDGCTFEIAFKNSYTDSLADGDVIEVYYKAIISANVTIGLKPHNNDVALEYGDDNMTEWDTVHTYTYGLNLYKYDGSDGDLSATLAGVEFELYRTRTVAADGTVSYSDPVYLHTNGVTTDGTNLYYLCNTAAHINANPAVTTKTLVTGSNGEFAIAGMDTTPYYLLETKPLPGYNPPADAFKIEINPQQLQTSGEFAGYYDDMIENNTGVILPNTGGMGTTIFYMSGAALALGALVLFITKRRMDA